MNSALDTGDNTKIYIIGSVHDCPVRDRDDFCCYKPFMHLDLKTVSEMVDYIPVEERLKFVNTCRECSFKKQSTKGSIQ